MKYRNKDTGRVFDTDLDSFPPVEFFETSETFELVEDEAKEDAAKAPAKKAVPSRTRKQA